MFGYQNYQGQNTQPYYSPTQPTQSWTPKEPTVIKLEDEFMNKFFAEVDDRLNKLVKIWRDTKHE